LSNFAYVDDRNRSATNARFCKPAGNREAAYNGPPTGILLAADGSAGINTGSVKQAYYICRHMLIVKNVCSCRKILPECYTAISHGKRITPSTLIPKGRRTRTAGI
jgi:hypothetical protein